MTAASVDAKATLLGLETLEAGVLQAISLTMRAAVEATEQSAQGTTLFHDRTGNTRQTIRGEWRGIGLGGFVQAGGASRFLENGTRPHLINSPVLIQGVGWRFIGMHPGTAERPFMHQAREIGERTAEYGADYFISEAIQRAR